MTVSIRFLNTEPPKHACFFSNFIYAHTHTSESSESIPSYCHSLIHIHTIPLLFLSFASLSITSVYRLLLYVLLLNADKRSRFPEALGVLWGRQVSSRAFMLV